jgi:hypothetical protein
MASIHLEISRRHQSRASTSVGKALQQSARSGFWITRHARPTISAWHQRWKTKEVSAMGKGILLWMLGVPIPIILILAMCSHH